MTPGPSARARRALVPGGAGLLAVAAAGLLVAASAFASEPPRVTLHPLPSAPRLSAPPATGSRADPRGPRLRAVLEAARERAAAGRAARAGRARGQQAVAVALERLRARTRGEVEVHMDPRRRLPRLLRGRLGTAASPGAGRTRAERTARAFLRDQRALLGLGDPDTELELARTQRDAQGRLHLRFRQRHRGVPVVPGELLVHLDARGDIEVVNGTWVATPEVAASPTLSATDAVAQARAEIAGGLDAAIPAPELVVWAPGDRPARLAWSVLVPASLSAQWRVLLDAASGALLDSWNTAQDADVAGSGIDLLGAVRALHAWSEGGAHFLVDTSKPMFDPSSDPPDPDTSSGVIAILDAQHQPPTSDPQVIPSLFHVTSVSPNGPWLADGVSALVNFSAVYDYYLAGHGRDSLDGQGGSILAIVRLGQGFQNAFFLSEQNLMAFGDAEPYAAALDVVAHELTHGVTFHSANLIYRDEPGALNEAMSDIFGELVEASVDGDGAPDWLVGSALAAPLRDLEEPGSLTVFGAPYPAHYSQYRNLGAIDGGGVHVNSSIVNHAFYQLAAGLSGNGIGVADAGRIFYRALTVYLTANARFVDARLACVQAAADLFPGDPSRQQRVREAFDLVGIVDGTGTPPPPPFPGTEGDDSTLFLRFEQGTYFLYRLEPDLDGGTPSPLSFFDVGDKRPAVTGDGSLAWFVDSLDDLCSIATDGSEAQETCTFDMDPGSSLQGQVGSIAVSPSGDVYGFVLRDPNTGQRLNGITIVDLTRTPPDDVRTYTLDAPVTVPGPGGGVAVATIAFADALEITAGEDLVIYDALNVLQLPSGGMVEVWSIYALDRATGGVFAIVPPQAGVDVGYPALAQRSDGFLVFDAVDVASGIASVLAGDLSTGALTPIATGLAGFSVPGYNGDDTQVIYSSPAAGTGSAFSLVAQPVSGRVSPQGLPVPWIADADYSTVYRRGSFVPEPGPGMLGGAAALALTALARRRRALPTSGPSAARARVAGALRAGSHRPWCRQPAAGRTG